MTMPTITPAPPQNSLPSLPWSLGQHLQAWAGYSSQPEQLRVVGNAANSRAGWSGHPNVVTGVIDPTGRTTLAVPASDARRVRASVARALRGRGLATTTQDSDIDLAIAGVPAALHRPQEHIERVHLRWTLTPAALPTVGTWITPNDPRLPDWLRPFGGLALCAIDERGRIVAGVGIKRHDSWAHELAVVTEPQARGRGLARQLIAQAARELLQRDIVPTYLHTPGNAASARVAEAAGFAWSGWQALLLSSAT
jgi:RimJ/RimL family protein N-acetyltransferase